MASDLLHFDPKAASIIINEELERAKLIIIQHIWQNGQNASGRTVDSLHVVMNPEGGTLFGRNFFGTMETGRRAGKIPYNFSGIILQWMRDKGIHGTPIAYKTNRAHKYIPQERGDLSMASAIAHTIAAKGTKLHRLGGRADVYSNVIPETMERLGNRLMQLIHMYIETIKLNNETIE